MMTEIDHRAVEVTFTRQDVCFLLNDGRTVCAPLEWFPVLEAASPARRDCWSVVADGNVVEWANLHERISVAFMLSLKSGWNVVRQEGQAA